MTRIDIQMELAAIRSRPFARDAARLNRLAVEKRRAQHERRVSPLAARYRGAPVLARPTDASRA